MLDRRRAILSGLAIFGPSTAISRRVRAQTKPLVKLRYSEVIRSLHFAPSYVAIAKGFFSDAGLDVELTTANGSDKAMAGLLSGATDISLLGPDAVVYVFTSESPVKARMFCGLTAADGWMLLGREKVDRFEWGMLKGKEILGMRPGSTPLLFLEAAMRLNGIDPDKDVRLTNNISIPARIGAWLAGQQQYAIFPEPDASQLEIDGKANFLASIGQTVGPTDYTAFAATDKYIHDNPQIVQGWTNAIGKALNWTASASAVEIAQTVAPWFPGVAAPMLTASAGRYRELKVWKTTPMIEPAGMQKFQDILVAGHVLRPEQRVSFSELVINEFASKAK